MKDYTMFQLCKEQDGQIIYYNYVSKKLYGCYNLDSDNKPNYYILLILPFINAAVKIFSDWLVGWGVWGRWLISILAIIAATICINIFYEKLIKSTEEMRNRRLRELPDPHEEKWEHYLQMARKQLKKQIWFYLWMSLGIIGSIGVFLWSGFIFYFLLYIILYFIIRPFILSGHPIRKYKLTH